MSIKKNPHPILKRMFAKNGFYPTENKCRCRGCGKYFFTESAGRKRISKGVYLYKWRVADKIIDVSEPQKMPPCPFCGNVIVEQVGAYHKYTNVMCPYCHYDWGAHTRAKRLCCPNCKKNFIHIESRFRDRDAITKMKVAITKCLLNKKTRYLSIPALQKYVLRQNKLYNERRFRETLDKMVEKGEGMYDNDYPEKPKFIVFDYRCSNDPAWTCWQRLNQSPFNFL